PVAVMVWPHEGQASGSVVHMPRWGSPFAYGLTRSKSASLAAISPTLYERIRSCASLSPATAACATRTSYLSDLDSTPRRLASESRVFDSNPKTPRATFSVSMTLYGDGAGSPISAHPESSSGRSKRPA